MYLINHVWVKTKCEAVVEGMGSTIARHGDKYRSSLGQENIEIEAFVAYNFPGLAHPGSKKLMEEVLNDYFGKDEHGKQKPWHFEHILEWTARAQLHVEHGLAETRRRGGKA